jgi:hypothetical protein
MAQDIAGRSPLSRRPSKAEIDILAHMLDGDPNGGDGRQPRRYIIGVMARKLNQAAGGPTSDTYRPAYDWPAYDDVMRLAEDGFLDTAGRCRCAVFATPEQRRAAARAVRAAGRYVRPESGRPTAESHFGMALDATEKGMLRALIGYPPLTQRRPHQLVLSRAGAQPAAVNAKLNRHLETMRCRDILSRAGDADGSCYLTKQQLRRAIQGFHLGLLGPDHVPANLGTRDSYGGKLGAGSAVRVASGLIDPKGLPIHYLATRPKGLTGRIERAVDVIGGIAWFLVHFGRGLRYIYAQGELTSIIPAIPAWPTDCKLRVTATDPPRPQLEWTGPSDCFFRVERSVNNAKWVRLSVCRGTTYIDYNARPGAANYYRVRSLNIEGVSAPGFRVKYTAPGPVPAQPLHADKPPAGGGPPPRAIWPRRRIVDVD